MQPENVISNIYLHERHLWNNEFASNLSLIKAQSIILRVNTLSQVAQGLTLDAQKHAFLTNASTLTQTVN